MNKLLLIAVLLAGCMFPQPSDKVPAERTFWDTCWDESGDIILPSDGKGHKTECKQTERLKWKLPIKVSVTDDLDVPKYAHFSIRRAFEQWNSQVGVELFTTVGVGEKPDVYVLAAPKHWYAAAAVKHKKTPTYFYAGVLVYDIWDDPRLEQILVHEFGHVLFLAHDTHPDQGYSIMHPGDWNWNVGISVNDIIALRAQYAR